MSWTVKKQLGPSEDIATVLLVPHKQNDGTRLRPVALEFTFSPERIEVRAVEPVTVEAYAQSVPLHVRMTHFLKRGPRTIAEMADELNAKVDTVAKAARRSDAFIKVTNAPDGTHRIALVDRRAS